MSRPEGWLAGGGGRPGAAAGAFGFAVTIALAAIMARVVQLQVAPGPRLAQLVSSRTSARPIPTLRGDLLDRRGRPLANTWFGYRLFIDPVNFAGPGLDTRITDLAEALGVEPGAIGERIIPAIAENQQRAEALAAARAAGAPTDDLPLLIRHVRIVQRLNDLQAPNVRRLGMAGVHAERIEVREYPGAVVAASIIGKVGFENVGLLGAERQLENRLRGEQGRVRYARDARGRPLWIRDGDVAPARRGEDARLSIDLEIQRIAVEELTRGIEDAGAQGGRLLAMDPVTGEVLAMIDIIRELPEIEEFQWAVKGESWRAEPGRRRYRVIEPDERRGIDPALGRNRCMEDVYEPGSTFKPVIWSLVTEGTPEILHETIETHGGEWKTEYRRTIRDVHKAERLTWPEALEWSSNIAMAQGAQRLTAQQLREGIVRFGFGSQAGCGLAGEAAGIVTSAREWSKWTHTSVAFGNEISVTVLQLARAYCALAAPGELAGTMPEPRLVAGAGPDGAASAFIRARVMSPATALRARAALVPVVERLDEMMAWRWPEEPSPRYTMFGKSGTADVPIGAAPAGMRRPPGARGYLENQYISSFVAAAPAERARVVVVVTIDDPGPEAIRGRRHYGSQCAGPVTRRFVERTLAYLGEPASVPAGAPDDRLAASN
jgi:cell division protein FtsI/penicillin-binding protein 2